MSINKKKKDESSLSVANIDITKTKTVKEKQSARNKLEDSLIKDPDAWDDVKLENMARKAAEDRYLSLQNSSYMGEVSRRILLGQDTRAIAAWLIITAPHEFPDVQMVNIVLQLDRFKKDFLNEVFKNGSIQLKEGKIPDISPIDMEVMRFKDRAIVVQGMMERAVLFQEARLIKAMSLESAMANDGKHVLSDQVSEELDRYMRYMERLGVYKKMIGKEDDGDSAVRELTHNFQQMNKVYELMPEKNKKEFREQIESLARTKAVQEREMKKTEDDSIK